jgi:hypothetical protein
LEEEADHIEDLENGNNQNDQYSLDEINQCGICLCPFVEGEQLKVLNCSK